MKSRFRPLCVAVALLSLSGCDKPAPPAAAAPAAAETDNQLAEAHDALQRQALEIETKTALMDKQLAEMQQSLKDRENAELQSKLEALKRQNEEMRAQADAARRQSDAIAERIAATPTPNAPPPAEAQPDYSMFYERLAPYGRWSEVNGYGYCWQPTISIAGWRPYLDGCWVWSEFGWAWQSNEPFGWATYHYGRWLNLASYGWVWVPGSAWAPAWVAWRQSSDCVGWAPLPPEQGICSGVYRDCDSRYGLGPASYVFININLFVSPSYIHVCAPVAQQARIFQCSVNVTQIVPRSGHRHAFVQQGGPPRAQMEHACERQVPQRPVQRLHAGQVPAQWHPHERNEAHAPVAIVELPVLAPSAPMRHPEVREHFQDRDQVGGFEGAPHHAAAENRHFSTQEKERAAIGQPTMEHPSAHGRTMHEPARHPFETPAVTNVAPVANAPVQENSRPAMVAERPAEPAAVPQPQEQGRMSHESRRHPVETTPVIIPVSVSNEQPKETMRSVVDAEHPVAASQHSTGAERQHGHPAQSVAGAPATPIMPPETKAVENSTSSAAPPTALVQAVMPATVGNQAGEPLSAAGAPVIAPAQAGTVVVTAAPQVMPQQPVGPIVSQPPVATEKMANDQGAANAAAEQARLRAAAEQAQATAMDQRQQRELQERAMAEKKATEQAVAETEKARQQAAAVSAQQQQEMAAQQQRMAADKAAAEVEKARQQAAAVAAQQQQEMAAQQQQRLAAEQAAAEAEKARQQAAAVAAQQQQEMAAQQQRLAAEQAAAAERVRQQAEAAAMQRQAEEAARRQQEAEMQRVQEQARAQQEAAQRAQEMAQRQAEEATRRAQEAAQRAAAEAAQRTAAEAARNQPQPTPPGQ